MSLEFDGPPSCSLDASGTGERYKMPWVVLHFVLDIVLVLGLAEFPT